MPKKTGRRMSLRKFEGERPKRSLCVQEMELMEVAASCWLDADIRYALRDGGQATL